MFFRTLIGLILSAPIVSAHAQLNITTPSNDWDVTIDGSNTYTHAINVGNTDVIVNGVVFDQYSSGDLGSIVTDIQTGNTYQLSGAGSFILDSFSPDPTNITGAAAGFSPGFVGSGGDSYTLQINDLVPGQAYQLSLYHAAWNDGSVPSREIDLTVNGVSQGTYDVQLGSLEPDNSRNGTLVTYGYTPSSSSISFDFNQLAGPNAAPHLHAFSNHEIASAPPAPSLLSFADVTSAENLGGYRASSGDLHSPGAVFTDLDNDGYADLYLVRNDGGNNQYNQLYLNKPDGGGGRTFQLQPGALGAENNSGGTLTSFTGVSGAIAADYDNDGDTDLYVTNFGGSNRLYKNQLSESGALSFIDATNTAGVSGIGTGGSPHSLSAAWADPDRDGDLDLYVGNHDQWGTPFNGERDTFYMNNGDGTFTDATFTTPGTDLTGFENATGGPSVPGQTYSSTNAVVFADFNNDQWPDLLVTNKTNVNDDRDMLYINQGVDGSGVWQGYQTATYQPEMSNSGSFGANPSESAMGVNVGDIDNDGDLDIYITDNPNGFPDGINDLLVNQLVETGTLSFERRNVDAGLSWGVQMEDLDNDGFIDIHVTNDPPGNAPPYNALFQLDDPSDPLHTTIENVASSAGTENTNTNTRGNVAADFNRDGKLDLFVVNLNNDPRFAFRDDPSVLYENTTNNGNHFLSLQLIGDPENPNAAGLATSLDAIGSRAIVQADVDGDGSIEMLLREVVSGSSNAASTSSLELEFGLGSADEALVSILWADGRVTNLGMISVDQFLLVSQANVVPEPSALVLVLSGLTAFFFRKRRG